MIKSELVYGQDLLQFIIKLKIQFPHLSAEKIINILYLRLVNKQQLIEQRNNNNTIEKPIMFCNLKYTKQQIQAYIRCEMPTEQINQLLDIYGSSNIKTIMEIQLVNGPLEKQPITMKNILSVLLWNALLKLEHLVSAYYADTRNMISQEQLYKLTDLLCDGNKWFKMEEIRGMKKLLFQANSQLLMKIANQASEQQIQQEEALEIFRSIIALSINQRLFIGDLATDCND